tara:strand:+ start:891 stop:3008 length:2118 start_codon:yes stop_codon:yes gene_type:complete
VKLSRKIKVLIRGPVLSLSGYGEQCRFALRSLQSQEELFDIYLVPINWGKTGWLAHENPERILIDTLIKKTIHHQQAGGKYDVSIQVTIPNEWEKIAPVNIGYTAGIESDKISPQWVEKTNMMDKIIVVSNHAKFGFVNTTFQKVDNQTKEVVEDVYRCTTPVEVVNFCVRNQDTGEEDESSVPTFKKDFNFLCVAQWGPRKNIENTVKWFIEEFRDNEDVGLVLKLSEINNSTLDKWRCRARVSNLVANIIGDENKQKEVKCGVSLLHGELTEKQMTQIYRHPQIKALINFAHGEGFGLPLFEAVSNGLPVLSPDWGGQCDFLYAPSKSKKSKKAKLRPHFAKVDYEIAPVQPAAVWPGVLEKEGMWCFPKEGSCKKKMREVYKKYAQFESMAKKLSKHINKTHSDEKQYEKFVESVTSVSGGGLKSVEISEAVLKDIKKQSSKDRAKTYKRIMSSLEYQEDKLKVIKDAFKGERCYVVSCGPSLLDHDIRSLKKLFADDLVICVKQAYDMFSELTDFHVYNCANFKKYDYGMSEPIILEASSLGRKLGHCDISFPIVERGFGNSLSAQKNFSEWTFDKKPLTRPYGPGIMYEMIFYLIEHLGISEVITIGWDNKLREDNKHHFYDINGDDRSKHIHFNAVDDNKVAVENLPHEAELTNSVIGDWYSWLKDSGAEMKIISKENEAPDHILRLELDELLQHANVA